MTGWIKEFKDFAVRGNVMDMAVGVIIGAAFGKIVTSLVNDVIMPPIGLLAGGMDFSNLFVNLSGHAQPRRSPRRRRRACPSSPTARSSTPSSTF